MAALFLLCLGLSLWLFRLHTAEQVEVWSEGKLLYTLRLDTDQTVTVTGSHGTNVITVQGGKVAVTEADCPDGYCMARGFCRGEAPIICLPNRLVLRFLTPQGADSVVG